MAVVGISKMAVVGMMATVGDSWGATIGREIIGSDP